MFEFNSAPQMYLEAFFELLQGREFPDVSRDFVPSFYQPVFDSFQFIKYSPYILFKLMTWRSFFPCALCLDGGAAVNRGS